MRKEKNKFGYNIPRVLQYNFSYFFSIEFIQHPVEIQNLK